MFGKIFSKRIEECSRMVDHEIIIEIDQVTSGKKNVISFCRKNKQINTPPLLLKSSSESSDYSYNHHFDKDDLINLNKIYPSIYPKLGNKNVNEWAENMKSAFKQLIEKGKLDKTLHIDEKIISVKFLWINK
jgi:hypothetical protein